MSTVANNRISAVMNDQTLVQVKGTVQAINNMMPFLIGLNTEERMTLPKMNVVNKHFVQDALYAITNNQALFPNYISAAELKKDLQLYEQLDELLTMVFQLSEKLRDTQILAGSEAYVSALSIYRMIEAASKAGMPGVDTIYEQLSERFSHSTNGSKTTEEPNNG